LIITIQFETNYIIFYFIFSIPSNELSFDFHSDQVSRRHPQIARVSKVILLIFGILLPRLLSTTAHIHNSLAEDEILGAKDLLLYIHSENQSIHYLHVLRCKTCIEARGFIFGPLIALAIGTKFVPMRKPMMYSRPSFVCHQFP
jgi:hypothetical protein